MRHLLKTSPLQVKISPQNNPIHLAILGNILLITRNWLLKTLNEMKNTLVLVWLLLLGVAFANAQTTLTTAVDFTVTDTYGGTHNLFDLLNAGKHVCVDFFFTTCGPCQATCGYFKESYTNYGCNTEDVFFISVDLGNTDAQCIDYELTFLGGNAGFPTISGIEGGGNAVVNAYGVTAFPTYILIAPNRAILEGDMWPIGSAADFDAYFNAHGLTQKACATVAVTAADLEVGVALYPNPATDKMVVTSSTVFSQVKIYDVVGKVLTDVKVDRVEKMELNVSTLASGIYYVELTTESGVVGKKFYKE